MASTMYSRVGDSSRAEGNPRTFRSPLASARYESLTADRVAGSFGFPFVAMPSA